LVLFAVACAACVRSGEVTCDDGRLCPPGYSCDDDNHRCLSQEQVAACNGLAEGADCSFGGAPGACRMGACEPLVCGDGLRSIGETCDGSDLGDADCTTAGFYNPDGLGCTSFCTFDVSSCTGFCGDDVINGDELCDGVAPAGTCFDLGYDAGPLACAQSCGLSFSSCARFGWVPELVGASNLLGFSGTSPTDLWVVGQSTTSEAQIAHYDGSTWTRETLTTNDKLMAVAAISPTDAWIARAGAGLGAPGKPLHYDGSQWSTANDAPAADYTDVWAASANAVYFASRDQGVVWWNGTTWQALGALVAPVVELDGSSSSDIWAVQANGTLQRWNGTTWNAINVPVSARHLHVRAADSVWVIGPSTTSTAAAIAHFNGSSFTTYTDPSINNESFVSVLAIADNDVWVSGPGGQVRHFDGQHWIDSAVRVTTDSTTSFIAMQKLGNIVFGVAFNGFVHRYRGQFIARHQTGGTAAGLSMWSAGPNDTHVGDLRGGVLHYNGQTWSRQVIDAAQGALTSMWGSGAADIWASGSSGRVYHYNGSAWSLATSLGTTVTAIWGTGPTDVWFFGASATHYDGSSYTATTTGITTFLSASGSGPNDVWALAAGTSASSHLARWNGSAWTVTQMPYEMYAIVVVGPNNVFVTADTNHILHYDGTAWTDIAVPVVTKLDRLAASAPDDVIASSGAEAVHFDGSTWTPIRFGTEPNATLRTVTAAPAFVDTLFSTTSQPIVRRLVRTRMWNCRAKETGCSDGVDDDCDGNADALDSDCP
jgi:hypothetical protein